MKRIFIAATKQNDGKTTVCLGLIANLKDRFKEIGFIKPIGQRYLEEDGLKIDEDSFLIEEAFGIKRKLKDMSPIAVEKGFTERYISRPDKENITSQIKESFQRISAGCDMVIIEGTGHAGVGSVFDHSNATVAKLLNSKVLLISSGGIGRPTDEIILNKALFDKEGVELIGVIINKVLPEKFDKVSKLVKQGLKRKGVEVLGTIPYLPELSYPTIAQILEETHFELLYENKGSLQNMVSRIIVGAMRPHDAISYITDDTLLVTPGDRKDMIKMAMGLYRQVDRKRLRVSGLVLTGGILPSRETINALRQCSLPVFLSKLDTYSTASILHDLNVKLKPHDKVKIKTIIELIRDYVETDKISERL